MYQGSGYFYIVGNDSMCKVGRTRYLSRVKVVAKQVFGDEPVRVALTRKRKDYGVIECETIGAFKNEIIRSAKYPKETVSASFDEVVSFVKKLIDPVWGPL